MRYRLEKHLLHGKPTHRHWCTGLLKGLREIYKANHRERHYCSQECLREGEERAAPAALQSSQSCRCYATGLPGASFAAR